MSFRATITLDLCTEDPECGPPLPAAEKIEHVFDSVGDHAPHAHPGIMSRVSWSIESEDTNRATARVVFAGPRADLEAIALGYCAGDPSEAVKIVDERLRLV
jgi:hypothetical protein